MKLHRLAPALGLGSSMLVGWAGCTLDDGTGTPDPGQYWGWVCPEGGTPLDASTPIDYVASGTCGAGGPFTLGVDGCEMSGSWSALGLSSVETRQISSTPGLGGWTITATGGEDGGASWTCTAEATAQGALTFTCSDASTAAITCQSTLTPVSDRDAESGGG